MPLAPVDQVALARDLDAAQKRLGAAAWERAWAEGLALSSEEAIALALADTEKTVGSHVDHIMNKLDLRSRTRIAVWATQHGLGPSRPD